MERADYAGFMSQVVKKYSRTGKGVLMSMPPSVYLNLYAASANTSFLEGVFTSPYAIHKRGVGKSVYCLKTLYYIYDKNVDEVMKHIVFMPQHFLALFKTAIEKNIRIRAVVWDDAGFWLGAQRWQMKFVASIREFMNILRTHVITLIVNAPGMRELARGIRYNLDLLGFVRIYDNYFDVQKRHSVIYIYDSDTWSMRQGRSYPPPIVTWVFKTWFDYYEVYDKMRRQYVEIGVKRAENAFRAISEEAAREIQEIVKGYEYKPQDLAVEKEINLDNLSEEEVDELVEEELGEYRYG